MIRGLYTSAWSMKAVQRKMDVVSNNISNVNSTAFKKDTAVFGSFPEVLTASIDSSKGRTNIGTMHLGHDVDEVHTDFSEGSIENTGSPYDFAIVGSPLAFFTVSGGGTDQGTYYTRNGSFKTNSNHELVTSDGYRVVGQNGPIILENVEFSVGKDGTITQNGNVIGKLLIREFTNPETLRKHGNSLILTTGETVEGEFSGEILQGAVETSNVNVIREMVDMINVMRLYEANQRMITTQDNTLERAVNDIGAL